MPAQSLPEAHVLVAAARRAMNDVRTIRGDAPETIAERQRQAASKALDAWAPAIDELVDFAGAARFLGLKGPDSIKRNAHRPRSDGSRAWPEPAAVYGASPVFTYRSIVINRAGMPGRGHPGALHGPRPTAADDAAAYDAWLRNDRVYDAAARELGCATVTVTRRVRRHLERIAPEAGA